jgi:MFS family permease
MQNVRHLLRTRRFLPIFVTQFLGAFNDNLFRTAMIMLVIYGIYRDAEQEATFSAIAGGLFILPFFLLSALAGQLADSSDKAKIVRIVKTAEILIMAVGAIGLYFHIIWLLLAALFAMGVHSTFFGPIKYAILPQHMRDDEVLGATGLVEAGTYVAILGGTLLGGILVVEDASGFHAIWAAVGVMVIALIGRWVGGMVPPPQPDPHAPGFKIGWHNLPATNPQVSATLHIPRLFLAIIAISFFWAMGAVLAAQFPPLVKNALGSDQQVATLFLGTFSIGVAIGSVAVNRLLGGQVSAKFSPVSAIFMGLFVLDLFRRVEGWPAAGPELRNLATFLAVPGSWMIVLDLLGVAIAGGMFVVPLYAFLTTTVPKSETARTIAANNIVNSGFMVAATIILTGAVLLGVTIAQSLLIVAFASIIAATLAYKLHLACD